MLSGVLTCHFVISTPKYHQINFRLTNDEFLRKHASKFQCTIPDWCKFSQLKILGCLSDTWHLASARGCQAWHAGMLPQQLNMSSSTCVQGGRHSWPDPVPSLGITQANHVPEWWADSYCKTPAGLDCDFQPTFSGRESLQHPQYPCSSGLAMLHSASHQPWHFRVALFYTWPCKRDVCCRWQEPTTKYLGSATGWRGEDSSWCIIRARRQRGIPQRAVFPVFTGPGCL